MCGERVPGRVPKYPLHQGLGLRPGAQEGSRGMEGRTPEAKNTSAAGK